MFFQKIIIYLILRKMEIIKMENYIFKSNSEIETKQFAKDFASK